MLRQRGRDGSGSRFVTHGFVTMKALDGTQTVEELLQWATTCRQWKDALRKRTSHDNLFRFVKMLGFTDRKSKVVLAEELIRLIENLKAASEPSAKMQETVEAPSPATPKPTRQASRSRTPRRGGGSMAAENAATPARSPHAAEALAMSTRKADAVESQVISPNLKRQFSRHPTPSANDVRAIAVEEIAGARAHVKALAVALNELQGNAPHAVWPKKSGAQRGLYYKLRAIRRQYQETYAL